MSFPDWPLTVVVFVLYLSTVLIGLLTTVFVVGLFSRIDEHIHPTIRGRYRKMSGYVHYNEATEQIRLEGKESDAVMEFPKCEKAIWFFNHINTKRKKVTLYCVDD